MRILRLFLMIAFGAPVVSCHSNSETLFTWLDADDTAVKFTNLVKEDTENNVLQHGYFYNGGGVATGDFNNDGLLDLYFMGNMVADKRYFNTTETDAAVTFDDLTEAAKRPMARQQSGDTFPELVIDIFIS